MKRSKRLDSNERIVYHSKSSRQAQDQKRYQSLGLCIKCQRQQSVYSKVYCGYHMEYAREYQRKKLARKRRNINSKSYKISRFSWKGEEK